jgi:hypothetical protein
MREVQIRYRINLISIRYLLYANLSCKPHSSMKNPIGIIITLSFSVCSLLTKANDGAFRVNGNQLIPMYETQVSVKKEILQIRRLNASQAEVDVYYEFST